MTLSAPLEAVLRRLHAEGDARNADNVARTTSYLQAYALTRETGEDWPWLLMAHLVSRNAGYLMVDVAGAVDRGGGPFSREALLELFAFLERANYLIFWDAWHHVLGALLGEPLDGRTARHMHAAYAAFRERTAPERERALVLDLVTNEQNFIERRVVHHPSFSRALAMLGFFEATGEERPLALPLTKAEIRVGGFAMLERRIDVGRRIFDEVLADPVLRADIYAWALETPHTGSRAAHGGRDGPPLRSAWPRERVRALPIDVHAEPEPDPGWA